MQQERRDFLNTGAKEKEFNEAKLLSINEATVELLPLEIRHWVKIIRPSRASLTYEKME